MPNREHLCLLQKGRKSWNDWRDDNRSVTPDLKQADLAGGDFTLVNLSRANLTGANLRGATLRLADLNGATLREARLDGAILTELKGTRADFANADLRLANLTWANLNWALLVGANLGRAVLHYSNLVRADLSNAKVGDCDFSNARFGSTITNGLDLRSVKGIEQLQHVGPSPVSFDMLAQSRGGVPTAFLRGCGLSDWEVQAAQLHADYLNSVRLTDIMYRIFDLRLSQPIRYYSCFISYTHGDKPFARKLHNHLQHVGIRCWLDEKQMLPGDDIYEEIDRGIRLWDKVLLCCSRASLTSWWVDSEIDTAFEKERRLMKEQGKKVLALIPLDLDGALFDPGCDGGKTRQIRSRISADFRGWDSDERSFVTGVESLVRSLRADRQSRERPPTPLL